MIWYWFVEGFPQEAATKERLVQRIVPEPNNCRVQEDKASYSIVHIYEEVDLQWYNVKLKKLLCLGTLISTRHILTTKLCFGAGPNGGPDGWMDEAPWGQWKPTVSIFNRNQKLLFVGPFLVFSSKSKSFLTLNETFLTCLIFLISLSVEFVGYTRNFVFSSLNYLWILPLIIISHSRFEQIKSESLLERSGAIFQNSEEILEVEFYNFDIDYNFNNNVKNSKN